MKNILFLTACLITFETYSQIQKGLDIDAEASGEGSGWCVSMPDGNTIGIGAIGDDGNGNNLGHVRIYKWTGLNWLQKGSDIDGEATSDQSGYAISMSDSNTVAIGAYKNDGNGSNAGQVRVYSWNGSNWIQKGGDIDGEASDDESGTSISMPDSNTVAIGAPLNDESGFSSGHVRVYSWNGVNWIQKGNDINGEQFGDGSGYSVSMPDSNTVAIGAQNNDGNGSNSGHVRVYKWSGSNWIQKGVDIDGEVAGDRSGWSVNMPDINTIVIGSRLNDGNGNSSGHVRVFSWNGSVWTQKGGDIDGEAVDDYSGFSISMPDSNHVAIGATENDGNGSNSGHVRIYKWSGSNWIQKGVDIDGEAAGDRSGWSVSMPDTSTIAIGAPNNNNTNGSNAGHVRVYFLCDETSSMQSLTECDSLVSPSGNYTWTTGGTYVDTIPNSAGCDSVMTFNLTILNSTSATISQSVCDSLVSPSGNYTWFSSGTYIDTIPNSAGCDSVITINLTVNYVSDLTTLTSGLTIFANNAGVSYQWLNCNDNYSPIIGEVAQSYTASENGNYTVELTENGCVDTSACVAVTTVSILESSFEDVIVIYPNPTGGNLTIDLGKIYQTTQISITNVLGELIDSKTLYQSQLLNLSIEEPAGKYTISIQAGDKSAVVRIIKE